MEKGGAITGGGREHPSKHLMVRGWDEQSESIQREDDSVLIYPSSIPHVGGTMRMSNKRLREREGTRAD